MPDRNEIMIRKNCTPTYPLGGCNKYKKKNQLDDSVVGQLTSNLPFSASASTGLSDYLIRIIYNKKIKNKQIKRTYLDNQAVRWRQMSKRFQVSAPLFDFGQLLRSSFHRNSL